MFVAGFRKRAPDQRRRAVAYVGSNVFVRERRQASPDARRVDGIRQVVLGIDQRSVQIEDQKIGAAQLFPFLPSRSGLLRLLFFTSSSQSLRISTMLSRNASFIACGASEANRFDASTA